MKPVLHNIRWYIIHTHLVLHVDHEKGCTLFLKPQKKRKRKK